MLINVCVADAQAIKNAKESLKHILIKRQTKYSGNVLCATIMVGSVTGKERSGTEEIFLMGELGFLEWSYNLPRKSTSCMTGRRKT